MTVNSFNWLAFVTETSCVCCQADNQRFNSRLIKGSLALLQMSGWYSNWTLRRILARSFPSVTDIPSLIYIKVNCSRYRPGVAQRVGRGIALLFHDCGTRSWWVVNSTPRPHFTPGKDPVPILQEAVWAPGPVWTGRKISSPPEFDPGPSSP